MFDSLWEEATESDWPAEEREQWYRERPKDEEYYRIQRAAPKRRPDPQGQADTTAAPRGGPALPLGHRHRGRLTSTAARGRTVPLARQPGLRRRAVGPAEAGPGARVGRGARDHPTVPHFHQRSRRRAVAEVGSRGQLGKRAASPRKQLLQPPTPTHQLLM